MRGEEEGRLGRGESGGVKRGGREKWVEPTVGFSVPHSNHGGWGSVCVCARSCACGRSSAFAVVYVCACVRMRLSMCFV